MNIDELSKQAIAEVEKELQVLIKDDSEESSEEELIKKIKDLQANKIIEAEERQTTKVDMEKKYLENVKERILVLFEALNSKQSDEDLQKKLELTINFIQFLLANIEQRLKEKLND